MLTEWTLHHFKSVYDNTALPLAPLTIFAGANSSGKSTVLQSLLLTAQTLQNSVPSRSVVLNGHILKLGGFADVLSDMPGAVDVSIGFELEPHGEASEALASGLGFRHLVRSHVPLKAIKCFFRFIPGEAEGSRDIGQLQPRLEECWLAVTPTSTTASRRADDVKVHILRAQAPTSERLAQYHLAQDTSPTELRSLEYEVLEPPTASPLRRYYARRARWKTVGANLFHFLPARLSVVYDAVEEEIDRLVATLIAPSPYVSRELQELRDEVLFTPEVQSIVIASIERILPQRTTRSPKGVSKSTRRNVETLRTNFSAPTLARTISSLTVDARRKLALSLAEQQDEIRRAARAGRQPVHTLSLVPLPELAEGGAEYVRRFFSSLVRYLGPLRDEPKPVYPLTAATDTKDVGYRGEHTAAVLDLHRETLVSYIPADVFSEGGTTGGVVRVGLMDAVREWLKYLEIAQDVSTVDRGKLGHELRIATGRSLHDLTHVGVGVSQVLPILVLALLADSGSTLVFEQPELHLHPRIQTRLADFFVSLTQLKKQCLIETHSEHLVNRLRYHAASSGSEMVRDSVLLYFVERRDGRSTYRPIRISDAGTLTEWPSGFFDEGHTSAAAILDATLAKLRNRKKTT